MSLEGILTTLLAVGMSIVSGVGVVLVFYVKKVADLITLIRIELHEVRINHDHTIERAKGNTEELKLIKQEQLNIRDRLHTVEGTSSNVMAFIHEFNTDKSQ